MIVVIIIVAIVIVATAATASTGFLGDLVHVDHGGNRATGCVIRAFAAFLGRCLFGGGLLGARLADALRLGLGCRLFCCGLALDRSGGCHVGIGFCGEFGGYVIDDRRRDGRLGVDADIGLILLGRIIAHDLVALDVVFLAVLFGFRTKQRLTVGERDLIIIGMDFGESQEAVAVAAVIDEGGLQRGLDPRYLRQIDIAPDLLFVLGFKVEFFNAVSTNDDNARLFFVRRVDKHFVCHLSCAPRRPRSVVHPRAELRSGWNLADCAPDIDVDTRWTGFAAYGRTTGLFPIPVRSWSCQPPAKTSNTVRQRQ